MSGKKAYSTNEMLDWNRRRKVKNRERDTKIVSILCEYSLIQNQAFGLEWAYDAILKRVWELGPKARKLEFSKYGHGWNDACREWRRRLAG